MRKATSLTQFDQLHLKAAESWLQFGNWREAVEELRLLQMELHALPEVMELHFKVHSKAGQWDNALEVAETMTQMWPENEWGYFHLALALHHLKRTQEAYDMTLRVVNRFRSNSLMRYNLACFACHLGRLTEALMWLEGAIQLAGEAHIRKMVLDDRDLKPLWKGFRKRVP